MDKAPNLLLVHDAGSVDQEYTLFFKTVGWSFDQVFKAEQGISSACNSDYQLVITDLDMPGVVESDIINQIRSQKPNQAVVVVASESRSRAAIGALESGATDLIQKPIKLDSLKDSVGKILAALKDDWTPKNMAECFDGYQSKYVFSTFDIGECSFQPPILNELMGAGLLDENTKLKVSLAFQEALTNAVEHGNLELLSMWKDEFDSEGTDKFTRLKKLRLADQKFADRRITIACDYSDETLRLCISDEGSGFLAPRGEFCSFGEDKSVLCYGRGLRILFGAMDHVIYEDGGRRVTIIKRISRSQDGA